MPFPSEDCFMVDAESFGKSVICGNARNVGNAGGASANAGNELADLIGATPRTLSECVSLALAYAEKEKPRGRIACRAAVAKQALGFARRAGTRTRAMEEAAEELENDERALVVEVAHQPTLFPYAGFYQKMVLGSAMAGELRKKTSAPVATVFGFLDTDFVQGKWFRKTFLPFSRGKDGALELEAPVAKKDRKKTAAAVPAPSAETIEKWRQSLATWLSSNESDLNKKEKKEGKENAVAVSREENAAFKKNLADVCVTIDECAASASSLAEFNSFFIAKTAARLGCGDFLFYEYGATQAAFGEDYEFLAKRRADYAASSKKHYGRAASAGIELGFNEAGESLAPFWFDCECGAKNAVVFENGRAELAEGKCVECGKTAASEEIASWKRVSPRAIARPIVVARGLSPCVFASGLGAFGFHLVARGVARDLGVALCPFATWLPEVRERGIAQRVSEGAGAADAVPAPSVLDAWINFGLESFGERMRGHLKEKSFCDELVLD